MTDHDDHDNGEPMELLDFLRARLDEDEALARAAIRRHGHWLQGFGPEADPSEVYEVTQEELDRADGCEGNHAIGSPNPCEFNVLMEPGAALEALPAMDDVAAHIVRHDPVRVLAEVAAKRAVVGEYQAAEVYYGAHLAAPAGELHGLRTALRLLALPYADHPDYDDTWKP